MPSRGAFNLEAEIRSYGVSSRGFRSLTGPPSWQLLDYLDLFSQDDGTGHKADLLPDGIAESQGRPLLFVVNESKLAQEHGRKNEQLQILRNKLACRGDRAYLAVIRPGELEVIPVSLDERLPTWQHYPQGTPEALTFFSRLASGHYEGEGEPKEADYVFTAMFKLVSSVADRLAALTLKRSDVLSLVGRALFFRFLRDRHVVQEADFREIASGVGSILQCFANAGNAANTSAWLDRTFNGDLLPLTDGGSIQYFEEIGRRTGDRVFIHLSAIISGMEPSGDENYQIPLGISHFGRFDFAHIPVGLLSQVYERFAWKWEHQNAQETSVHYTPRNIAATLVDEAFSLLPNGHAARILDPACGASVFLVLAFRQLYKERWKATGKRPDTKAIREILEKQLTGFDISDSALKLAALSLYLTAIELDPQPVPPGKLKFSCLRDKVLFNFRRENIDPTEGAVAGSLGSHVNERFDGQFDLVLSNPPWTSLKKKERPLADELNQLSKAIIRRRSNETIAGAYENPDFGPDLPFVWKATEWCKDGGRIAMALPARILLKQEEIPRRARETLLRLLEVTGIINGTNLSDTAVWRQMSQPFILLFARNRKPKAGHSLRLITPQYEASLNSNGEMRIDAKSVQPIEVEATFDEPWIWKTLALGTTLDADVVGRFKANGFASLNTYWKTLGLPSRQGYFKAAKGDQMDAEHLHGLPDLTCVEPGEFLIDIRGLPMFDRKTLYRAGKLEDYKQPLVLMKQAPGQDRADGWAMLSLDDVAYSRVFHGYSAAAHPEGEMLCRYVQLFSHTLLRIYYALCTKPRFGAERRVLDKADVDDCPIFPFERLTSAQRQTVADLSARLIARDATVFTEVDAFFASLFGLDHKDMEVVRDTVEVAMPYIESRDRACNPPRPADRERFRRRLESILRPFFKVTGDGVQVRICNQGTPFLQMTAAFGFLTVSKRGADVSGHDNLFQDTLLKLAEDTGSTRIIQQVDGGLIVALLNQYRYWTPSRARLIGAQVVREHLDGF